MAIFNAGPKPVKRGQPQCPCAIWGPGIQSQVQTGTWLRVSRSFLTYHYGTL